MILPPATLGMLGGGQLGRFFVSAAHEMGYKVWVLDPDPHSPAGQIAERHLQVAYDDYAALDELAQGCAAITTEFENVPADTLDYLAKFLPVRPAAGGRPRARAGPGRGAGAPILAGPRARRRGFRTGRISGHHGRGRAAGHRGGPRGGRREQDEGRRGPRHQPPEPFVQAQALRLGLKAPPRDSRPRERSG